jgi:tRNA pseudouridine38-40 synthase
LTKIVTAPAEESPRYIAFLVSYDGAEWCGFQRQTNAKSVQGELERALQAILGTPTPLVMAGRTDTGVHGTGQCCRFATTSRIPAERFPYALNTKLDRSVRITKAWEVQRDFHPRYSAKSRLYRYSIDNAGIANPMLRRIAGHIREPLDVRAMQEAAPVFIGEHDFMAWQSAGSPAGGTVRVVKKLKIRRRRSFSSNLIEVEIEANAFLYQMVRNIVGALIEVGRGRLSSQDLERMMRERDRTKCPPPAPPQGLCLEKVKY